MALWWEKISPTSFYIPLSTQACFFSGRSHSNPQRKDMEAVFPQSSLVVDPSLVLVFISLVLKDLLNKMSNGSHKRYRKGESKVQLLRDVDSFAKRTTTLASGVTLLYCRQRLPFVVPLSSSVAATQDEQQKLPGHALMLCF